MIITSAAEKMGWVRGDATKKCEECLAPFGCTPREFLDPRKRFCSRDCMYDWHARKQKAQSEKINLTCVGCGKKWTTLKCYVTHGGVGGGKYCSNACKLEHRRGKLHPAYRGGHDHAARRGPNWNTQRYAALKRDSRTCQECFKTTGRMEVHHVIPYRYFDDYKEANKLSNLVTLCPSCHASADAKIWRDVKAHGRKNLY